jgi:hypothetical protein
MVLLYCRSIDLMRDAEETKLPPTCSTALDERCGQKKIVCFAATVVGQTPTPRVSSVRFLCSTPCKIRERNFAQYEEVTNNDSQNYTYSRGNSKSTLLSSFSAENLKNTKATKACLLFVFASQNDSCMSCHSLTRIQIPPSRFWRFVA